MLPSFTDIVATVDRNNSACIRTLGTGDMSHMGCGLPLLDIVPNFLKCSSNFLNTLRPLVRILFEQPFLIAVPNLDFFSFINLCVHPQPQRIGVLAVCLHAGSRKYIGDGINYRLPFLKPPVSVLGLRMLQVVT